MTPLTYGSVCSGIEGASVAFAQLGWRCAFMAETEAFPRAVLKHHYPEVPLYGDFTKLRDHTNWLDETLASVDVLVGGTPCQGFSVAGLRGSLADDRSNLCLEFIRLADAIDDLRRAAGKPPCWVLWENVPGVFSTKDNAFGAFLGGLVGSDAALDPGRAGGWTNAGVVAGPGRVAAWRVLDAQHFGLAQRRRRVFVLALGGAGAWRCADALLPIAESLQGHPAPRRQAREVAAGAVGGGAGGGGCYGIDSDCFDHSGEGADESAAARAGLGIQADLSSAPVAYQTSGNCGAWETGDVTGAIDTNTDPSSHVLCFDARQSHVLQYGDRAGPLQIPASRQQTFLAHRSLVRRLTPAECERLQGFPDGYTDVPFHGKPAADGPRYKALGNSFAPPVVRWIGERLEATPPLREEAA